MKKIVFSFIVVLCTFIAQAQTTLTLSQSRELVLRNNFSIQNSCLEVESAHEVKKNAFTNYFPKLSANIMAFQAKDYLMNINTPGGNLPVYDGNPANLATASQFAYMPSGSMKMLDKMAVGSLSLVQPIYVGGKIRNGNKLAQIGVEVKEKQQTLAQNEAILKTEQQYWLIISLQERRKTLEKYEALLDNIEKQVNDAYKGGLILRNDVLKVQLKKSELQLNKKKLANGRKLALMQFCQTIGIPNDSTLTLTETIQNVAPPQTYLVSTDEAVKTRTEYQLLNKSVEAQSLQTQMKTGDYMPQVAAGAMAFAYDSFESGSKTTTNGMVYLSVSIPISDWWGGKHAIKEQKINERIAQNKLVETTDLLKLQIEKYKTDLIETYQQIQIAKESLSQAEENLKVNTDSYKSGVITVSDLLEAQALQVEAANKLIEIQTQYQLAITNYLQATGK